MRVQGSAVAVTGAGSGLGLATATRLVERGAKVMMIDLPSDSAAQAAETLDGETIFAPADVTDEVAFGAALDAAEAWGGLRAVVHCAGRGRRLRLVDREGLPGSQEDFEFVMRVNLVGSFNALRLGASRIAARDEVDGERGAIVLTSSVAAFEGQVGQLPYAAAKAGIAGMTIAAARDLASRRIRVCTIAPGLMDTPPVQLLREDFRTALIESVPSPGRLADPRSSQTLRRTSSRTTTSTAKPSVSTVQFAWHPAKETRMADVEYTVSDGVGTILLNRPHLKNAFTMEMIDLWADALRSAQRDPEVRVVVVTGAGGAFCSGIDLDEFESIVDGPLALKDMLHDRIHKVALALEDLDKPYVAAVQGVAVGAGMDMSLMADIRLLATSARMSEGYIRIGLIPGDGGCYYLPRLIGMDKALELIWTGRFLDAAEAAELGIATHVYDDAEFEDCVAAYAQRIAAQPPINVQIIKRAAYQSAETDVRTALDLISSHMAVVYSTADFREAMSAFRGGRKPVFEGR